MSCLARLASRDTARRRILDLTGTVDGCRRQGGGLESWHYSAKADMMTDTSPHSTRNTVRTMSIRTSRHRSSPHRRWPNRPAPRRPQPNPHPMQDRNQTDRDQIDRNQTVHRKPPGPLIIARRSQGRHPHQRRADQRLSRRRNAPPAASCRPTSARSNDGMASRTNPTESAM